MANEILNPVSIVAGYWKGRTGVLLRYVDDNAAKVLLDPVKNPDPTKREYISEVLVQTSWLR